MKKITLLLLLILPFLGFGQTWNFDNSKDGWTNLATTQTLQPTYWELTSKPAVNNPGLRITPPVPAVDPTAVSILAITMKNLSATGPELIRAAIATTGDAASGTKYVSVPMSRGDTDFKTYYVDCSGLKWVGTVSELKLQFKTAANGDFSGTGNEVFHIDKIEMLCDIPITEQLVFEFNTDSDDEGWVLSNGTSLNTVGGNITIEPTVGAATKISQNTYSVDADANTHVDIVYRNLSADNDELRFQWQNESTCSTAFNGFNTVINQSMSGFETLTVDLSVDPDWIAKARKFQIIIRDTNNSNKASAGNLIIDRIEFYTPGPSVITSAQIGSWSDTTTWTGGIVPTSIDDAQLDHAVTINGDEVANNVTINSGASLIFNAGKSLILSGDLVTDAGVNNSVVMRNTSTSYSSLIVQGTVSGDIRHRRFINANPVNDLISPAVNILDFSVFYTDNGTRILTYGDGGIAFGPFTSSTGSYTQYTPATTTALTQGTGYVAGASGTPDQNFNFHGTVRTDQVDVAISGVGVSTWNLIGNPYPSYVNFDTFHGQLVTDGVLESGFVAIYGYNGTDWTIWDGDTVTNSDELIAPGQGFFVRSNATGGDVSFTPGMRAIASGTATIDDDFISGRVANTNSVKASLNLLKNEINYPTNIIFKDGKTRSLDYGGDTASFSGPGSSAINIYTNLVEDNNGLELYNQALPYNDFNDVVVPLGVEANLGEQISIGLDAVSTTIPTNINVYLEDNVTNTWTLLNTGDYTFTPSVDLTGTGRFFAHFSSTTLSAEETEISGLQVYLDQSSKSVNVRGQLDEETQLVIYDVQGRKVLEQTLDNGTTFNNVNVNTLNTGVYIVHLNNRVQTKTQKIIIR